MDDFYAARSGLIPPLPWSTFSPPFSRLSVDNLFDETYYERSGYAKRDARGGIEPVYAPGRTITFGGTVKF